MPFNPCLVGNWCIGRCDYNINNVCMFDPIARIKELILIENKDECDHKELKSLMEEWEDAWLWENQYG